MVHPFMAYSFRVYYFCAIWIALFALTLWDYLLDSFVTHSSSSLEICNLTGDHNAIPQIMLIFIFV